MNTPALTAITVNDIGEYIRHQSCDRRFYLKVHYDREVRPLPFFDRLLNTLEPVLSQVGKDREDQWEKELTDNGFRDLAAGLLKGKHDDVTWQDFAAELAKLPPGMPAYARQVRVQADLGAFAVSGLIDFVLVKWNADRPRLWLVECKASRRDRTYHRIQVALYRMLLQRMLVGRAVLIGGVVIPADSIECMIARIDEDRNTNQSILTLPALDLTSEEADIERLLDVGGRLDRAVALPLGDIGYRLDTKCDGCIYNVHCLTESARQRRPELLGIEPVSARLLHAAGLKTLDDLAQPAVFPPPAVEALLRNPGFDENLKLLEVRAKARRHTLPAVGSPAPAEEHDVASIPNTGVGHLPAHEGDNGRLLRVYLAVDYDYSENRIGALSAHVTRSDGRLHTRFVDTAGRWEPDPELLVTVPYVRKSLRNRG
ncbi:PD-(D/E)XK nuclease family protein [Gemmata sp. G18]|uniref:PD-(D/E)XK nuclease family protein n=1 Tax=Gemmata palustris TaxID=2822762 RepID=A0ABS5BMV3_9BACT|nr:PD-(D/E)XK nuclease family protein [Gemmata palustris]MBP3955044.1 PD-(D/E)XK nuclease family protein [Gemmata palustris]